MHELSIALSLIDAASDRAERLAARVSALHVRIGPLSGVVPDALLSAFELAREGTALQHTALKIEATELLTDCPRCLVRRQVISLQDLYCAVCGKPALQLAGGRELELTALEIEAT